MFKLTTLEAQDKTQVHNSKANLGHPRRFLAARVVNH